MNQDLILLTLGILMIIFYPKFKEGLEHIILDTIAVILIPIGIVLKIIKLIKNKRNGKK